jgi:hypothetical protein
VFVSAQFAEKCARSDIFLEHTGTESHNSLGSGETYHSTLRRVYKKVAEDHPSLAPPDRLLCAVSALNSLAGPDGLVPMLLVFGSLPRLPGVTERGSPSQ